MVLKIGNLFFTKTKGYLYHGWWSLLESFKLLGVLNCLLDAWIQGHTSCFWIFGKNYVVYLQVLWLIRCLHIRLYSILPKLHVFIFYSYVVFSAYLHTCFLMLNVNSNKKSFLTLIGLDFLRVVFSEGGVNLTTPPLPPPPFFSLHISRRTYLISI